MKGGRAKKKWYSPEKLCQKKKQRTPAGGCRGWLGVARTRSTHSLCASFHRLSLFSRAHYRFSASHLHHHPPSKRRPNLLSLSPSPLSRSLVASRLLCSHLNCLLQLSFASLWCSLHSSAMQRPRRIEGKGGEEESARPGKEKGIVLGQA